MAAPSTRWLCLLRPLFFLLLLQGSRVAAQLTIGSADSFLPEHLDANAVSTTGKTIEVTPLSDASVTNAAADAVADAAAAETASDANSPGASEADDYLFTATDSPSEDTTLPDFDDYTVDGTETTTKFSTPENDVTEPGKIADLPDYLVDGEQGDSVTTASSDLTRRIVFTGPDATATTPSVPLQSTRPSSVLRELNDPTTASWLPNWPSHLLEATKEFRRPSVRFPTGPPPTATQDTTLASSATISPSYTVTKVPVTQYYFDLASVNPTPIPGPLFDRETVTTSSSVVSSVLPDVTQPLESEDLPSSISELQSSVLVDAAEPPVTSTPALPPSTTSIVVTTDAFQSITPSATTETVPPTSTVLNEVVEGHLDNTLTEESQTSGTAVKETPETSEVMPSGSGSTQSGFHSEHSENTTTEDPDSLFSLAATSEAPQPTNISQPVTQPSTLPAPSTNSEPLTTTSSTTPGSVKPSSARTSPAAKTSRIPLWQRLSQSSPSRPNTQPSSTPLTPSNAATLAADAVMPLSSALPPLQSTSVEPPLALDESSPVLAPSPPRNESIQEPVIPDEQDPPTPLDIDDPDEVLTRAMKSETGSVVHNSTEPPSSALEPTEYPLADTPELNTNTEAPQNTTTQDSNVDTLSPASIDQHSSVDNTSNVEVVDNALDGTHPNTLPSSNTSENKTQHGNGIFDDPKVSDDEPLPIPVQGEKDPVVDPSEIPVTLAPTVSVTWTPIIEETESVPLPTSTASVPIATTVVTQTPPEILTGFTPIISATHTIPTSQSELVPDGSATSASSASTVEFVDSSTTTSAPAQDLSTPSAPSSTLTASLAPTTVHKTDSTPIPPEVLVSSPVPVPLDVPVSSAVPAPPDVPVSSAVPVLPDVPVSSAVPDPDPSVTSTVPVLPDVLVSSSVPASSDVPVSSAAPVLPDVTESSALPVPPDTYESSVTPDVVVSSAVPVLTEVPVSSATPMSTAVPMLPDAPISSASIAILPTPSLRPTSDSPTLVVPTATDDPIPTLLPQPLHPEEGGEEETHEEMPVKEEASESEMEPPPLPATTLSSPSPPDTTTSTTTTTTSSTTSSTTTTMTTTAPEKVPETEAPAVKPTTAPAPDTTTAFILPEPEMNNTTAAPGEIPMLTTTTVLDNGTEVVVALPYIRALVDYNAREFCQHQDEFRSLFGEWITQDLNGSVKVMPKDIRYFAMADCPSFPSSQDGQTRHEDAGTMQEKNHTHVYFYITSSSGEVDRELTEKFPLFPTDLVISEDLKYLVPRVMQLEVVRPDESSSQDQVQEAAVGTSVIVIIVICSIVGVTIIVALFFFMVVKRRGATNNYYGRRCTPVSMDAYSMDSVSVYHSFRRKSKRRASGRSMKSYLNQAFDDPNGPSRPLNFAKLTHFISDIDGVYEEFATIPVNMPKYDELPPGVEDKNRYANVIPVPETRVLLKVTKDGRNCEYINANFVRGARNESKYYIATQAPLDDTVADFWRMVWEQESRVVVMLTDFVEKGIDKCADYLPPSETLDCHRLYGDFQVTLKSRDMREKFVVSNVQLKNLENNLMREVAHMWFTGWPASGVPNEEGAFISFILEVRRTRKKLRAKGPIVVHCSPGTGRTGTLLASDIVMKQFEEHRTIDVPRTVYAIRRDRAGAVQTKEQYAFIYRVINLYASKLTSGNLESL
ncbi:mucin-5AC-like isoform X2 [Portunus trituberculatus]|uniref:mucin-5AC-like isoform X2 n=1 Tax=Portunus trituberculatus TaxID=210409 RepID=UPI001E1CCEC8|nr:mucin-5AC-like isoform X2 [Portunus trituberculatus]